MIKNKTVLVVDDDEISQTSIKLHLSEYNYNVLLAKSGQQAIDIFNSHSDIHLILMDIHLGFGMNGIETAKKILLIRQVPIIFLTNYKKAEIADKTANLNTYGYVVKSEVSPVLNATIKMAIKLFEKDKSLRLQNQLLNCIIDSIPDILAIQHPDHTIVKYNKKGYLFLNKTPAEVKNKKCYELIGREQQCEPCATKQAVESGKLAQIEKYIPEQDIYLDCRSNPVFDEHGNLVYVVEQIIDITKMKKNEEKIKLQNAQLQQKSEEQKKTNESLVLLNDELSKANADKEVLIREVHHRVKNNLQIIQSILNMQKSYIADDVVTLNVLDECINRIRSMSAIHENLYQTDNFSNIDMNNYIRNLASHLYMSYSNEETIIDVICDIDNIYFDIETSVPIGLLLNELISNALKHAFKNRKQGNLYISLKPESDVYLLKVKDDGIGLPDDIDLNLEQKTYGFTLINLFVRQLSADICIIKNHGTEFVISFKNNNDK